MPDAAGPAITPGRPVAPAAERAPRTGRVADRAIAMPVVPVARVSVGREVRPDLRIGTRPGRAIAGAQSPRTTVAGPRTTVAGRPMMTVAGPAGSGARPTTVAGRLRTSVAGRVASGAGPTRIARRRRASADGRKVPTAG